MVGWVMEYESNSLDINIGEDIEFDISTYCIILLNDLKSRTFYIDRYTENFVLWI